MVYNNEYYIERIIEYIQAAPGTDKNKKIIHKLICMT